MRRINRKMESMHNFYVATTLPRLRVGRHVSKWSGYMSELNPQRPTLNDCSRSLTGVEVCIAFGGWKK